MRTDLNMRKGKMIAQGAHAAMLFWIDLPNDTGKSYEPAVWLEAGMKKICVRIDSEEGLLDLYHKALEAGLRAHIVTDAGHTEFNGTPTRTCIAIGPNEDELVDGITGSLTLL